MRVFDNLPTNATYVSCAASIGNCGFDHLGVFNAFFVSLASGAQATLTITMNVGCSVPSGTVVTNTATVSSLTTDPVPGNNNSGPVTFTVRPPNPVVNAAVSQSVITLNNHEMVTVGLSATATYATCSTATTFTVQVYGNEDDQTPTAKNELFSPDGANIDLGSLRLRADRLDSGNGRVYLIVVTATSAAGGVGFGTATVVVPKSISGASVNSVLSEAAAAASYAGASNGAPPPGYFAVGDGPVIGSKQ
jgi:hypothetical protein